MLDALKFAFEILIVGALTVPWLMIVVHLLVPDRTLNMNSYLSPFPEATQGILAGILLLAFGYVAGSAVSRISRDLFNDEMFGAIPSEDSIRNSVYTDEYCKHHIIASYKELPYDSSASSLQQAKLKVAFCEEARKEEACAKTTTAAATTKGHQDTKSEAGKEEACAKTTAAAATAEGHQDTKRKAGKEEAGAKTAAAAATAEGHQDAKSEAIREMFSLQEGELLLLGQDKLDRMKQYYDQITVLRGAAANALMLFMVCVFGECANLKVRLAWPLKLIAYLPSAAVLALGNYSLLTHVRGPSFNLPALYIDPPLAESVVILLGMLGFIIVLRAKTRVVFPKAGILAAVLFIVCFEGWWWTEVMYDLHIIHSQTELHSHLDAPTLDHPATPAPSPTTDDPAASP